MPRRPPRSVHARRGLAVAGFFSIVILLASTGPPPAAAHSLDDFDFEFFAVDTTTETCGDPVSRVTPDPVGRVIVMCSDIRGDGTSQLEFYKCEWELNIIGERVPKDGANNCIGPTQVEVSGASSPGGYQLDTVGGVPRSNQLIACWFDEDTDDLRFIRSIDGGDSFQSVRTVDTTGDVGRNCDVADGSSSTFWISYEDTTGVGDVKVAKSTDSGVTWTNETVIAGSVDLVGTAISARDVNEVVLAYQTTSNLTACKSTDGGAAWACAEIGGGQTGGGNQGMVAQFRSSEHWLGVRDGTTYKLGKNPTGDPADWSFFTIPCIATSPNIAVNSDFSVDGNNLYTACEGEMTQQCTGSGETAAPYTAIRIIHSDDGGGSWSQRDVEHRCSGGGSATRDPTRVSSVMSFPDGDTVAIAASRLSGTSNIAPTWQSGDAVTDFGTGTVAAVTNLVGFDVDRTGSTIITRQGLASPQTIKTYGATNLGEKGSVTGVDCGGLSPRITAGGPAVVAYVDCTADDPDFLRIRNDALSELSASAFPCSKEAARETDIDLDNPTTGQDEFGHADSVHEMHEIEAWPLTYTRIGGTSVQSCALAWGFSTSGLDTDEVGVAAYTARSDAAPNAAREAKTGFGAQVDQICAFIYNGKQYLGGAGAQGAATRIFEMGFSQEFQPAFGSDILVPSIVSAPYSSSVAHSGAQGLDCERDLAAIATGAGRIAVVDWDAPGAPELWSVTSVGVATGGISISEPVEVSGLNGTHQFVAWADTTTSTWSVAFARNGSVVASGALPAGTIVKVEIHHNAQALWVATRDNIAVFDDLYTATSISPVGGTGDDPDVDVDTGPATGIFSQKDDILSPIGIVEGGVFLGFLLMVGMIVALATSFAAIGGAKTAVFGGIIGIPVGIGMSWAFELFDTTLVFVLVALSVGALVLWFFGVRS